MKLFLWLHLFMQNHLVMKMKLQHEKNKSRLRELAKCKVKTLGCGAFLLLILNYGDLKGQILA